LRFTLAWVYFRKELVEPWTQTRADQ